MRNIFDQYQRSENRLTHALATCFHESPTVLASFAKWVDHPLPKNAVAVVRTQYKPGNSVEPDVEQSDSTLPDIWLDDANDWALVIENKIEHAISVKQLRGHLAAARSFKDAKVLLISINSAPDAALMVAACRRWTDVYRWARSLDEDPWARRFTVYMETLERRLSEEGKLNGMLTAFTGIPFAADNPYAYREAKRLLRLLMQAVRASSEVKTRFGTNDATAGRSAITNSAGYSVWDMLPLAREGKHFTSGPHLTVGIGYDEVIAQVTLPNGMSLSARRKMIGETLEEYREVLDRFSRALEPVYKLDPGCMPFVEVLQRHFAHLGAPGVRDASLVFDPRTANGAGPVKAQPQWAQLSHATLLKKSSNLQFAFGVRFPYRHSVCVATPELARAIVQVFVAMDGLLERWKAI